jgi:hypothetical protein
MLLENVAELSAVDRFLYWIKERHQVYLRRQAGKPKPWTDDEVLQSVFFTNPYRENDKVTVWFRENIRDPLRNKEEVVFATVAFRWFCKPDTGLILMGKHAQNRNGDKNLLLDWDLKEATRRLRQRRDTGHQVFTGAFMISNGGSRASKLQAVCENFITPIWEAREEIIDELKRGVYEGKMGMKDAHELLMEFPGMGGFMAYEVVCDLRYTWVLENAADKLTWCNPGPGAKRGLNRLLERDIETRFKGDEWKKETIKLLATVKRRLPKMPPFEMREVEHSLCEWDKYERARMGQGHLKRMYKGV